MTTTPAGKRALLTLVQQQLRKWRPLLHKYLPGEDEQVDLLLTLEEFISQDGCFAPQAGGEQGKYLSPVFLELCKVLYDEDIVEEDAFLAWAEEKQHAAEEDKVFLKKAAKFIEWLQEEEEDEEDDEEEDGE